MSSDEENNPHKGNGWKLQLLQLPRWVVACMSSNSNRKLKGWKKAPKAERWEFLSFTNGIKKESHWRRQEEGGKKLWDSSFKVTNKYTSLVLSQVKKLWEQGVNMPSVVATLQEVEAGISVVQDCPQLQHQVWGQSCLRPIWKLKKKKKSKKCIRILKLAAHEPQFSMIYRFCKYTYIHMVITYYFLVPTKENSHILRTLNHNTVIN